MTKRGVALFLTMGVIWGVPYLLIKVAVREISPATLVFGRTVIGAVVLLPLTAVRRELRAALRKWRPLAVYTVVEMGVPWVLLSRAEERLPSSLTGLLVAAVPLIGAVVAFAGGDRSHLKGRQLLGLLVGLGGVAVLLGFDVSTRDAVSVALLGVVVLGYAIGPVIVNRYLADVPATGVVALSLVLCAVVYAPFALTDLPHHASAHVIESVVLLGLLCTALAFVLFFALIVEIGPVRATVITYINPAVAVVLGVVFLHESFTVATAAGFVLIIAGSILATRRGAPEAAAVLSPSTQSLS